LPIDSKETFLSYRPESKTTDLKLRLAAATAAEDWSVVEKLAAELSQKSKTADTPK
jgi:hypothetical protein